MGVPKFYRWLSERYPQVNQVITDQALLPEFDHLYLDMNGIIHGCTHPAHLDVSEQLTERDMMLGIMHYIDRIVSQIVKPKVSVYMAIDGVAPRAKMNQQRSRRFRSAKDMADMMEEKNKLNLRSLLGDSNEAVAKPSASNAVFDSNCITPGTVFLNKVSEHIKYFIRKKIKEDPLWRNLKVYYSGPDVPGEGEHKIMQHIREMKASPGYQPNTRHCMYGQDADLIMLGLVTHEPHFTLLREVIDFNAFKRNATNSATQKAVKKFTKQSDFQLLHLSILREYLNIEFVQGESDKEYRLESVIDDFVFLTFLVGNDFLPHMPALDIGDGAFDLLFNTYKDQRLVWGSNQYLVSEGKICDATRLELYLSAIGKNETEILEKKESDDLQYAKKRRKWDKRDGVESKELTEEEAVGQEKFKDADFVSALASINLYNDKVVDGWNPKPGKKDYKGRYYWEKLNLMPTHVLEHIALRKAYIEGLMWCLAYYYRGCISWGWFYPYHYGPMLSDLTNLESIFSNVNFDLGEPFLPFQQLMGCLPPASSSLVPRQYRLLMCDQNSPILHFYPKDFKVDMNGKRNPWEGVNLLPFIDGKLLKETIMNRCPDETLTAEERLRNRVGKVFLYSHDFTETGTVQSCNREIGLLDISLCHSKQELFDISYRTDLVFKPEVILGTKIPYPGFPSLNVLPINETGFKAIGVNCFGSNSKYSTMVLNLRPLPTLPTATELSKKVLNQTLFVNWPMMHEAKVVAISDAHYEIRAKGKERKSTKFTEQQSERWHDEALIMKHQYLAGSGIPGSGGVEINDVQIRLKVVVLQGMRVFPDGSSKKVFGKEEADIPLQMALWASPAPDHRFIESRPKSVQELYPEGSNIVLTKGKHLGCKGKVIGVSTGSKNQSIVASVCVLPPEPPFGLAIAKSIQDTYISTEEACKILKMKTSIFGKITGSLFVNPGRYDLGLNLKYKKELYILGYTRMKDFDSNHSNKEKTAWVEGDSLYIVGSKVKHPDEDTRKRVVWEYTPKAIRLIAEYRKKFPELFNALNRASINERSYDARVLFGKNGENKPAEILTWLKSIETASLPRIPASSMSLPKTAVLAIQRAAEVRASAMVMNKSIKTLKLKLPPSAVYKEGSTTATTVMSSSSPPILGDRFVNLCANGVPFGARGTIVGIHSKSGCVEVVMDEEFIGGSSLQGTCSNFRGKLCVWVHLRKLTQSGEVNVEQFAPAITPKLSTSKVSKQPKDDNKFSTEAKIEKVQSSLTSGDRNNTPQRSSSVQKKQGVWKEAKGPPGKGSGFKMLKSIRKVKSGVDGWKNYIHASKKLTKTTTNGSNQPSSELKAILGITDKTSKLPNEAKLSSVTAKDTSSASLKAILGVGQRKSDSKNPVVPTKLPDTYNVHKTPNAADLLVKMMMNTESKPKVNTQTPSFSFKYFQEGGIPINGNPNAQPSVPNPMYPTQLNGSSHVERVKKGGEDIATTKKVSEIVPSSIL